MKKTLAVLLCVVLMLTIAYSIVLAEDIKDLEKKLAKDPNNLALIKEVGIYYHELASKGDKKAVTKALTHFEKAKKLTKDSDYIINAWYGSTLCLVGRDSKNPLTQYFKVKDGLKLMDAGVDKYPDNYEIRMTRAMTTVNLPDNIFHRLGQAIDDFLYLINKENATPGYMPERERLLAYLNIGIGLKEAGNLEQATKAWKRVIEINPESPQAKEATELLKKYKF